MKKVIKFLKHKRILGLLLGLAILTGLLVPAAPALAANPVQITMNPISANNTDTTVDVPLYITNSVPLTVWAFNVHYDPAKLTYTGMTAGTTLFPTGVFSTNNGDYTSSPGTVTQMGQGTTDPSATHSTPILLTTMHFNIVSGTTNSRVSITMDGSQCADANAAAVAVDFTGNKVTIGTPPPPPPPTITSFSPTSGAAGQVVTINGTLFQGDADQSAITSVQFSGYDMEPGSLTIISATSLTARVPVMPNGESGQITLFNSLGAVVDSAGLFTYSATPTISGINPTSAYTGQTVQITGTGFVGTNTVTFGGTAATNVVVNSTRQITATVGAGASGNVTVTNAGGTATKSGFTYIAAAISSFTPTSAYSGDTVVINGSGFTGATAVSYGGVAAASYTVVNDNSIRAVVAATGASGNVTVSAPSSGTPLSKSGFTWARPALVIAPSYQSVANPANFSVTLNINTNGPKQVRVWQADLTFDPTKVQCTSITEGTFFSTWASSHSASTTFGTPVIDNIGGRLSLYGGILGADEAGGATGNGGALATINFSVRSGASNTDALISLANPLLADAIGASIPNIMTTGGTVHIGPVSNDVPVDAGLGAQLTFIAPASVSGWNLVVTQNNNVQRTLNVFANTAWQVSASANNGGRLTQWNGSSYNTAIQLANPLSIWCDAGPSGVIGSIGNSLSLATGGVLAQGVAAGQNAGNGGDIRGLMLNQTVTYTDPIVTSPNTYHIVITFTATASY